MGAETSHRRIDAGRIWLLIGCLFGRHKWEKQRGTFGTSQVAPNGIFYEAFYCIWCGRGYPCKSIVAEIFLTANEMIRG